MSELAGWNSFYVIVGSAAGTLIGLHFVVVTLIPDRPPLHVAEAGAAFATPTVVYFGAALLLSTLLRAPWHAITVLHETDDIRSGQKADRTGYGFSWSSSAFASLKSAVSKPSAN
jgi:hypothetical protein